MTNDADRKPALAPVSTVPQRLLQSLVRGGSHIRSLYHVRLTCKARANSSPIASRFPEVLQCVIGRAGYGSLYSPARLTSSRGCNRVPSPTLANQVFLPIVSKACADFCILFEDDFNDGLNDGVASSRHWNAPSLCQYGATVEVVADPTGSVDERGMVLKVTAQTPVELPWRPGPWQAGYPAWINFHANGDGYASIYPESAGVQTDVWVDPLIEAASLLSVHRQPLNPEATIWTVAALEIHNYDEIAVYALDDKGNATRKTCTEGLFRRGEWNTLRFIIEVPTGKVLPFINGQFALASVDMAA